jgi:predicted molibdopterin-dependent oxidoreductase YjgC
MSDPKPARIPRGTRGPVVRFDLDGAPCQAFQGETIAAAMLAAGRAAFRHSPLRHEPRGLFCGMGVCFECVVTVNGVPNTRACVTPVEAGMTVETGVPRLAPGDGVGKRVAP